MDEMSLDRSVNSFSRYRDVKSNLVMGRRGGCRPEVSIVIPTYNRPSLLKEAVESALSQETSVRFEVLVVDNCQDCAVSTVIDSLIESFSDDRLFLYRNECNIGMFGNWNRAIELARGSWLTILNDDDRLKEDWLDSVAPMRSGQGFVATRTKTFGQVPASALPKWLRWVREVVIKLNRTRAVQDLRACDYLDGHPFSGSLGVLFQKRGLVSLGGYDERFWPASDYILSYLYWKEFGGVVLNNELCEYRWEENASKRPEVVAGFIEVDYFLRSLVLKDMCHGKIGKITNWYNIYRAKVDVSWVEKRFSFHVSMAKIDGMSVGDFGRISGVWLVLNKILVKVFGLFLCFICGLAGR